MKRTIFLVTVALLLAACGGDDLPTQVPTADTSVLTPAGDESPRATPPSGLPPTWTPVPPPPPAAATQPAAPVAPAAGQQETYEVEPGDTLAAIAASFNVTLEALATANGITNLDLIEVGQVLIIPR